MSSDPIQIIFKYSSFEDDVLKGSCNSGWILLGDTCYRLETQKLLSYQVIDFVC